MISIFCRYAGLLSRHTIIEMLQAKVKLLLLFFSLSIVVEFTIIILDDIATCKAIIIDINNHNNLYI